MTDLTSAARRWAKAVDGQWIDTGDPNTGDPGTEDGPQCVDLAKHGAMDRGAREQPYGHARDFATNLAAWSSAFEAVPVPADPRKVKLLPFDVVSLVGGRFGTKYGHVVIAQGDDGDTFTATQQNPRPAHTAAGLDKRFIVAVARPVGSTPPARTIAVLKGDGWWATARRAGVPMDALLRANAASVDDEIHPGQVLKVPAA